MATGASAVGFRRGQFEPLPSGPGVTLDDWIDWAMVTVGIRTRSEGVTLGAIRMPVMLPPAANPSGPGPGCTPGFEMGEAAAVPAPTPDPPALIDQPPPGRA